MTNRVTVTDDEHYRYTLFREVSLKLGTLDQGLVVFIMLNPSTAEAIEIDPEEDNDRTIKKCKLLARNWGFRRLLVVNLFAYRATKPEDLKKKLEVGEDIVGSRNDDAIREAVIEADRVVCAWGDGGSLLDRGNHVWKMVENVRQPYALGMTKRKQPRHPLSRNPYIPDDAQAIPWNRGT